jgi:hypothetical protein
VRRRAFPAFAVLALFFLLHAQIPIPSGSGPGGGSSGIAILQTQVTITSAQLLAGNSTAVQIIPGSSGKRIMPLSVDFTYNPVSTPYTDSMPGTTFLNIFPGNATEGGGGPNCNVIPFNDCLLGTVTTTPLVTSELVQDSPITLTIGNGVASFGSYVGSNYVISVNGGTLTLGNGTLTVTSSYYYF